MKTSQFQMGELIENRYHVLSVIGTGGMGTLYRVSDKARDDEIVALKTLRADISMTEIPDRIERFQREFQLLTQLCHPNLVSVYDYGITTGGELYFTMEWIEGQALESKGDHPWDPVATIPVIVQVCRALAYLHDRGVIHGDMKPSNVLLIDNQVKIVDFGIAFEARSPGVLAWYYTPGYSAPEVRRQHPADHRIDLYGMGALWYTLLMGEPPLFMVGTERLIQLMLAESLTSRGWVSREIGKIVARLLATSPDERYASANEVVEEINRVTGSAYALETRETAASYALRGRFVGREAEMKALQEIWRQVLDGDCKLVLISGEAGVGKTRLVEEFVIQAELKGKWVARGQCVESGGSAYRPWREVLRVLVRYVEGARATGVDVEKIGPVLTTLLPELWKRGYMATLAPPPTLDTQAAQVRLNSAIAQVLQAAAGLRSAVIVVEDAHWADEATLELLGFLARASGQMGWLVCVTYRDDESTPARFLDTLSGSRIERIRLHTLSSESTADLLHSMLGPEKLPPLLVKRVQQTTGGNPFFVRELVRSLAEEGIVLRRTVEGWHVDPLALQKMRLPESIRQVARQRLRHLSTHARRVIEWAAVVGPLFWDGAVAATSQIRDRQLQAALDEGLERELIFEREITSFDGNHEFMFVKPAVQEVSYENVPRERRRKAHHQVAAWLLARSDEQVSEHLGLIADHLERAGQTEQAVTYLRRAGEQAAAQFANVEAITYFSRALDLIFAVDAVERYALLLAREKVYDIQGMREVQAQDLDALEELAEALDDDAQPGVLESRRAEVALRRSNYAEATGDYPATIAAAQMAICLGQAVQDVGSEANGHLRWGWALWRLAEYEAAQAQLEKALSLAQAAGLRRIEVYSLLNLGITFIERGDFAKSTDCYERALDICHEIGDPQGESWAYNDLGIICSYQGDHIKARNYWEQALRICRQVGDRRNEAIKLGNLGNIFFEYGDYAQARTYYEEALHIHREVGDRGGEALVLTNLGSLLYHLGDAQTAWEHNRQALCIASEIGERRSQGWALVNMGDALLGLGQLPEAIDAYRRALDVKSGMDDLILNLMSLAGLARVSLAHGDLAQAQVRVAEVLERLEDPALEGIETPLRAYLTCYRVLCAIDDPRAQNVLNVAHRMLQDRASRISDEEIRHMFLSNVAVHREIAEAWEGE